MRPAQSDRNTALHGSTLILLVRQRRFLEDIQAHCGSAARCAAWPLTEHAAAWPLTEHAAAWPLRTLRGIAAHNAASPLPIYNRMLFINFAGILALKDTTQAEH
jgi:hypothetical protein